MSMPDPQVFLTKNEVHVGIDPPADLQVELWFDPDAVVLRDGTLAHSKHRLADDGKTLILAEPEESS